MAQLGPEEVCGKQKRLHWMIVNTEQIKGCWFWLWRTVWTFSCWERAGSQDELGLWCDVVWSVFGGTTAEQSVLSAAETCKLIDHPYVVFLFCWFFSWEQSKKNQLRNTSSSLYDYVINCICPLPPSPLSLSLLFSLLLHNLRCSGLCFSPPLTPQVIIPVISTFVSSSLDDLLTPNPSDCLNLLMSSLTLKSLPMSK